jgi:hypothetical protein
MARTFHPHERPSAASLAGDWLPEIGVEFEGALQQLAQVALFAGSRPAAQQRGGHDAARSSAVHTANATSRSEESRVTPTYLPLRRGRARRRAAATWSRSSASASFRSNARSSLAAK